MFLPPLVLSQQKLEEGVTVGDGAVEIEGEFIGTGEEARLNAVLPCALLLETQGKVEKGEKDVKPVVQGEPASLGGTASHDLRQGSSSLVGGGHQGLSPKTLHLPRGKEVLQPLQGRGLGQGAQLFRGDFDLRRENRSEKEIFDLFGFHKTDPVLLPGITLPGFLKETERTKPFSLHRSPRHVLYRVGKKKSTERFIAEKPFPKRNGKRGCSRSEGPLPGESSHGFPGLPPFPGRCCRSRPR
ncbi:MAG: hypothetical protein BWY86_00913 [Candidatus Aminicenantes bacterium ADurb.Bin508]|nr:MAG: hypothetical protein BWY86_00913 [Candidatus Aminicenantes bacterium ADurb.Bin508]